LRSNSIVIVGGGTAGWMAATTFVRLFPKKKITLIESPNIRTIGVGESTIGQLNQWLSLVGIKSKDFMKSCNATFKFNIRFNNFLDKNSGYYDYPFGSPDNIDNNGANLWYFKKIISPKTKITDYADSLFPIMALVNNNKIHDNNDGKLGNFNFKNDVAYHFDATKFALWLRDNVCLPSGLNHIKSEVKEIKTNKNGIRSLELENGESIKGDLFIDCTGFKSILLERTLGEEFISFENILPNNSAWATHVDYTNKEEQMITYAYCDAVSNGWIWTTPLWESIGTGYVYSDKYISPDNALKEFKKYLIKNGHDITNCEFNKVPFRVGIHKRLFVKNVVAIGLSAGFIEPLESNGLVTIHEFLFYLSTILDRNDINQFDKDTFNHSCRTLFQNWAEFVALHYALSVRNDTPYWRDNMEREYDKGINDLSYTQAIGFRAAMYNKITENRFPEGSGISCIATGMNWFPMSDKTLRYANKLEKFDYNAFIPSIKRMDERKKEWNSVVKDSPTLYKYLKKEIY